MRELRSITNRWDDDRTHRRIPVEHFRIFQARPGAAYNHHGHIGCARGRLYASWSNGVVNEDRAGQHVLFATSEDRGRSWSEPRVLAGPWPGRFEAGIMTNNGILASADPMVAFAGYYDVTEYSRLMYFAAGGNTVIKWAEKPFYESIRTLIFTSVDQGESWQVHDEQIPSSVLNLCPGDIGDGRLLYPGNARYWYTDDTTGLSGWKPTGIEGLPEDYVESPAGFDPLVELGIYEAVPCEASWYRLSDGSLHMMHRTSQGTLAVARSEDRGATWTKPLLTRYTDLGNRMHFGNLPDGRAFGLSTPRPGGVRTPLVLAVSDDGWEFDRNYVLGDDADFLARLPGMHKYGRYGYPYLCWDDRYGYALYSVNKEDIWVARFHLEDLV